MDKLIFPSGGMFLDAEDLEFQDAAYREAMKAIVKAVSDLTTNGAMVVWGCQNYTISGSVDLTKFNVGEGYVYINGELCYFSGDTNLRYQNIDGTNRRYFWQIESTYDPTGTEILASGATGNTYEKRRVILVNFTTQTGVTTFRDETPNYLELIKTFVNTQISGYTNIGFLQNGWTAPTNNRAVSFRKANTISLEGQLVAGQASTTAYTQMCTLNSDYRPVMTVIRLCAVVDKGMCQVKIETDGKVYIIDPLNALQNGGSVDFGGISFDANL
jgi:hypothetical protein